MGRARATILPAGDGCWFWLPSLPIGEGAGGRGQPALIWGMGDCIGGSVRVERSVWKRKVNIFLLFIPLVLFSVWIEGHLLKEPLSGLGDEQKPLVIGAVVFL